MRRRTKFQPIGGRVGLKLREFLGVFRRQRVGDGGEELRHLHQRALQPAEDRPQILRVRRAVGLDAEHPRPGHAGRDAADRAGGAGQSADFAEQVATGHRHTRPEDRTRHDQGGGEIIVSLSFGFASI